MEARVGDIVDVPGGMHGTVKFVGEVAGKKGKFAGVQLAEEYAGRGKNSGDVEGKHYFRTATPGSGIFLPVERALRRGPPSTPSVPTLTNFNQGGRTPVLPKPNFSQSVGPGARAASPTAVKSASGRRPSLPRYDSPLRKTPVVKPTTTSLATPGSRPSFGAGSKNKIGTGSRYGQSPMGRHNSTFNASVRGTSGTPSRAAPLGPEPSFDEDPESTPTPTPAQTPAQTPGPTRTIDQTMKEEEARRLKNSLEEKDRQLKEQAITLSDMEKSLAELHSLLPAETDAPSGHQRHRSGTDRGDSDEVVRMRSVLRDKNEKIQMLIAEFDAHRADFRSTIDTLEMASTETERVYEKRVEELMQEVRELQERGQDVENVAEQLKQLEDLVQELEEGLEDARRGEAEARSEVEFLRGEVERGRLELKQEKNKAASAVGLSDAAGEAQNEQMSEGGMDDRRRRTDNGYHNDNKEQEEAFARELNAKDSEIKGLKAIIYSLSGGGGGQSQTANEKSGGRRMGELEALLQEKASHEQELQRELDQLRHIASSSSTSAQVPSSAADKSRPAMGGSYRNNSSSHHINDNGEAVSNSVDHRLSDRPDMARETPTKVSTPTRTDNDSKPSPATTDPPWCEICETTDHDIMSCGSVYARGTTDTLGDSKTNSSSHNTKNDHITSSSSHNAKNDHTTSSGGGGGGLMNGNARADSETIADTAVNKSPTSAAAAAASTTTPPSSSTKFSHSNRLLNSDPNSKQPPSPSPLDAPPPDPPNPPNPSLHPSSSSTTATTATTATTTTTASAGMVAGKSSGVIDPNRWCALCERDGHESVDCPFEDGF